MLAMAAHLLAGTLDPVALGRVQTAATLQVLHALALLAISLQVLQADRAAALRLSGVAMVVGMLAFCGALYALAFTGVRAWAALAPFGGFAFIVGWLCMIWPLLFSSRREAS